MEKVTLIICDHCFNKGVHYLTMMMPDHQGTNDDDETLEPHFNDTGDFGDIQDLIQGDDEDET
jgi:hypothetical protein